MPGVTHLPSTIEALEPALAAGDVAALVLEPIKGEAGVVELPDGYLRAARELTTRYGALLILDEIQTGAGRTGDWFAFQHEGIVPDAIALAKGIGGGFPIGALVTFGAASELFGPGHHGSTFGGNPLACAVGNAVLDRILGPGFIAHVDFLGQRLAWHLQQLQQRFPNYVVETRGKGLIAGLKITPPVRDFVTRLRRDHQLLAVAAGDNVLRLLPPLVISEADIEEAMEKIAAAFTALDVEAATTPAIA
jgi:acetylornithine/N-succinyldiaminopimelate aminotransferase